MIEENFSMIGASEEETKACVCVSYNYEPNEVDVDGFETEEDVWKYIEGFEANSANFDSDVATITVVII